uniref:IF rod domain-containing protein n=1 Tax=Crocodylus porosus TaxID=8502 RepID=A0A7M4FSN6_CROPO
MLFKGCTWGFIGGSCKVPYMSRAKSVSVCSSGIRSHVPSSCILSSARPINCYLDGSYCRYNEAVFSSNGKETMQLLNDHLASYLEKVKSLEKENADLECKIREWQECQIPLVCTDFSSCYSTIEELQQQICNARAENARLHLDIDNIKEASDDFSLKYEYEQGLCQSAEADISSLHRFLDDLTLCKTDLETELESLTEELLCLRKNHEEVRLNTTPLQHQLGDCINVELDTAPSCDLNKVLEDIRCQYETLIEKKQCEVENWYHTQMEELNKEVISDKEQLQGCQNEIIQLKHTVQALEIDLQTQHSLVRNTDTLTDTETRYSHQLSDLQCLISNMEAQLAELRSNIQHQNSEYKVLLDVKSQLDCEISAYRRLLDEEGCKSHAACCISNPCLQKYLPTSEFSSISSKLIQGMKAKTESSN